MKRRFWVFVLLVLVVFALVPSIGVLAKKKPKLNKTKITMYVDTEFKLRVKNGIGKIKWSSSKKKIASVNKKGVVTAKKAGKTTIIAKLKNKKLKCKVRVKNRKKTTLNLIEDKNTEKNTLNPAEEKNIEQTTVNPAEENNTEQITLNPAEENNTEQITLNPAEENNTEQTTLSPDKFKNKKILFLGDSVTSLKGDCSWVKYFNEIIEPSLSVNIASGGSRYCDYDDTVYDGKVRGGGTNHSNVIGNQVEKVWRGKDPTHPGFSIVDDYQQFDIIILAAGSNDAVPSGDIEPAFTQNRVPVNLSDVDRTTFAGAFRYSVETLQNLYPDAKIFICTPIQAADSFRSYKSMNARRNYLIELANRMSVEYIDTFECGICGIYETFNANGRDLQDGIHPNVSGAKKIGKYNAKNIICKYID